MAFNFADCAIHRAPLDYNENFLVATREKSSQLDRTFQAARVLPRDVTYSSSNISLDTAWKDELLFGTPFSKSVGGNKTISLDVQIICKDCYIRGTFQATLVATGSTDVLETLVNYGKTATADVKRIASAAIDPLQDSLVKGAKIFLNTTSALEDKLTKIFDEFLDEVVPDIKIARKAILPTLRKVQYAIGNETLKAENIVSEIDDAIANITGPAFHAFEDELPDELGGDFLEKAIDWVEDKFKKGIKDIASHFHVDKFAFPTVNLDFALPNLSSLPAVDVQFRIDGLELYMDLDLVLSAGATYSLPLFRSETPIGVGASTGNADVFAGAVLAVDLLLDIHAQIDIRGGFHLKVDDTVVIDLEMFSQKISHINFPGAKFEFLPVTITSGSTVITGALAVTLEAGLRLDTKNVSIFDETLSFGSGVDVKVLAHVAQFETTVKAAPRVKADDCGLSVQEYFEVNIGAAVGANVRLNSHTWGPDADTVVPVFTTTLASVCALTASTDSGIASAQASPTVTGSVEARDMLPRQNLVTTTLTSTIVYTGRSCASTGMLNCPVSLQVTQTSESIVSLVTAVSSGVTATFPTINVNSVPVPSPFGTNAKSAVAISGSPTPYSPSVWDVSGDTGGVPNRIILGVSLGLGIPIILLMIGAFICFRRRRGRASVTYSSVTYAPDTGPADTVYNNYGAGAQEQTKKTPLVSTAPVMLYEGT